MKKALFTYNYGETQMEAVRRLGYDILYIKENEIAAKWMDILAFDPEVLVCYAPFNEINLNKMTALKWIQLSSIGIDQVPVEATDLLVTNNRGGYSIPMGEWIVFQMLNTYKFGGHFKSQQLEHKWKINTEVRELTDRKALFIGTGTIASEAVKRLCGFEIKCFGINTKGTAVPGFEACYPMSSLDEMLPEMDFVILTIPHTKATEKLISQERLNFMKADSVLINVARGSLIDEKALEDCLGEGKFLGVALDVFETEPLSSESTLWQHERVYITPHNSWISEYRNERRFELIYKNLQAYVEGHPLENVVDLRRGY